MSPADRLQTLEARCRLLMVWAGCTTALSVLAVGLAVVSPVFAQQKAGMKELRVRSLIVEDDKGQERITLQTNPTRNDAKIVLKSGDHKIDLTCAELVSVVTVGSGKSTAGLGYAPTGPMVTVTDGNGDHLAALGIVAKQGFISIGNPGQKPHTMTVEDFQR